MPGGSEHVRVVEDIVTGETKEMQVVRMRPYADSSLIVGAKVREVFKMTNRQGEFEIADVISVGRGIRHEWENTEDRSRGLVLRMRSQRGNRCQLSTPTLPST